MSIARIAERAGVSPATVSLVINGKPTVAEATAANVRKIMDEMGYTPPPLERRQGRRTPRETANKIAVVATMPGQWLSSPVFGEVLHGLERHARENNSSVLLHHAKEEGQPNLQLLDDDVNGLILFGGQPTPQWLGKHSDLPCVRVMGSPDEEAWCDHVTYKNVAIGALAARYLLSKGHTHAATLCLQAVPLMTERSKTFSSIIESSGGTVLSLEPEHLILISEEGQSIDKAVLSQSIDLLLAHTPRPTALFLTADIAAPTVYLQLLQRGVKPGEDIEIVSCNNERSLLNGLEPRPAVVDIHALEVGRRAMERLFWRMANRKAPPADMLIHPELIASH